MTATLAAPTVRLQRNVRVIRGLIWIYFILLIFEGSLRMLIPPLSDVLLIVRDPFLLFAYVVAQLTQLFPWSRFVFTFWMLGAVALMLGMSILPGNPTVLMYGFRCSFLHMPLIFLIPRVMNESHVIAVGRWFLIFSVPVAALMATQFVAGPDSWLNRGLDLQFTQISAGSGKVRPPGTFTAVIGPSLFFAYVVAFLVYSQFKKNVYSSRLVWVAATATTLGSVVSISRSALASVAMVVLTSVVGIALARPQQSIKFVRVGLLGAIAFIVASQLPVFDEGAEVFSKRIETASQSEGGSSGFVERFFGTFIKVSDTVSETPIEGFGLGRGTNAGAIMYSGGLMVTPESEWSRFIFELGPILGIVYLFLRVGLGLFILARSFVVARLGHFLPMMLVGATWLGIVSGQWKQTTILGFAILGGGLCLAAMNLDPSIPSDREQP